MLQIAFKEWAVMCEALGQGQQAIILRKGGVAEDFSVEHSRFWLYPTYVHQQTTGINDELRPLLQEVEAARPLTGTLRLQLWANVTAVYRIRDVVQALLLSHLHGWSEDAVRKRFDYKVPGLKLLAVRVHRVPNAHQITETPTYAGCRSWVELETPLSTDGSVPVLNDNDYHIVQRQLDLLLNPTALA